MLSPDLPGKMASPEDRGPTVIGHILVLLHKIVLKVSHNSETEDILPRRISFLMFPYTQFEVPSRQMTPYLLSLFNPVQPYLTLFITFRYTSV